MLIERLKLFREIAIDCSTSGGSIVIELKTDTPAPLTLRRSITTTTSGRQTVRMRLPWTTKGYHVQLKITPASGATVEVFEAKVQAKPAGTVEPSGWAWFPVYVRQTPDGWGTVALPIRQTPEGWGQYRLPIPPTPEGWSRAAIAMPGFNPVPQWVSFPLDEVA